MKKKIIIVGGVAGGASTAARLRRLDEDAQIILLEKDGAISFANCGLPYHIGGVIERRSALLLHTPESFHARFRVDVRVYHEAIQINRQAKTLRIQNKQTGEFYEESYDKLVLSPGATPIRPPIDGIDAAFTLRNLADTDKILQYMKQKNPRSAVVVGGGFIGVEMAESLHRAGLAVTIVEMQNQLVSAVDCDMACAIHQHVRDQGVQLLLNNAVTAIHRRGETLQLDLTDGSIETEMLIMAVGVKPATDLARAADLQLNPRGYIVVNENMQSSDDDIYALGDAVELTDFVTRTPTTVPLAGPANKQGRIVADHICGIPSAYRGAQATAILRAFDMTVATTGISERTAARLGIDYDKVITYSPNHATYYPNAQYMTLKVLFETTTGKILGAQIVGYEGVDKRCDVLATAIRMGATAHDLTQLELSYAPPYSSAKDPVNMVGYVIENLLSGRVKQFHHDAIATLPRDGSVTLLDTRTPSEYRAGHIDGFVNIPLDELRERLDELTPDRPIYLTCAVGQRGYLACRILTQRGYECYNLCGGYRFYHSVRAGEKESPCCSRD